VVVGLKRLSASIYSVGEIPVIGNEGEILWWWEKIEGKIVWLMSKELWRKDFCCVKCDFIGFFCVDNSEWFFCFIFFNDFLCWRINLVLKLILFGMKRCKLLGFNFECLSGIFFLSWR
jgi:hypothetical protein